MNILVTGANGQLGREMQRLSAVSPNNYTFMVVFPKSRQLLFHKTS